MIDLPSLGSFYFLHLFLFIYVLSQGYLSFFLSVYLTFLMFPWLVGRLADGWLPDFWPRLVSLLFCLILFSPRFLSYLFPLTASPSYLSPAQLVAIQLLTSPIRCLQASTVNQIQHIFTSLTKAARVMQHIFAQLK